jgi:hypothetical protein
MSNLPEGIEYIKDAGRLYAIVIRGQAQVSKSRFFTPAESSFQFGLLANTADFVEAPHYHHAVKREINDLQQMLVVQRGKVAIDFFDDSGRKVDEVSLISGDAILLITGVHSLKGIEDFQCASVKQGPFLGEEKDKIEVKVKREPRT